MSRVVRRYAAWTGPIGGELAYRWLRRAYPTRDTTPGRMDGSAYRDRSKIETLLGAGIFERLEGKTVLDFGCGMGSEVIELAERGARQVIGLDINPWALRGARENVARSSVADRITITDDPSTVPPIDLIISLDSFEHFWDPGQVLEHMAALLPPGGRVLTAFGPTWYHPLGGHVFSPFIWAHLVFDEATLCRWRNSTRATDHTMSYRETGGGPSLMSIRRFIQAVDVSPLDAVRIEAVPIRKLAWLHNRLTREFTTAIVRAELRKPAA